MEPLTKYNWWGYLEEGQRDGLSLSFALLDREKTSPTPNIHDFSFIVFPAAKAYEGFLKKLIYDLGFITRQQYSGERYRIGKALNPNLDKELRHESIYDELADFCQGKELPDRLWKVWKTSRNLLFHWWPGHMNSISLEEAQERLTEIVEAIDASFTECKLKR